MSVGNRVFLKRDLPSKELVEAFKEIPAANIEDCMNRIFGLNPEIKLMSTPKQNMVGVALTVKTRAGDNLMIHQALEMAGEGDIIIVSNEGDRSRALIGEVMAQYAQCTRKVAGLVFDGAIRDIDEISKMPLSIYASGYTPSGPFKEGPGEVNVPIAIGGVIVMPGDILVGDSDGVIVIPKADAETVLAEAKIVCKKDAEKVQAAIHGTANKNWVNEKLVKKECEFIDKTY
ncbi:RraA family protein [Fusibacter ferrireducens]|uniref:Putative 4-hydroxy-4-methyl-2-oxoglutarate aldolase n=1 Tax=Fusibacter ferrireducens TaxID=2785058 RepID=A0ABR9ZRS3_9FIRM|nr:RraA family protein [Fusibacter ferrireducens]MBF4693152.1 RraA family protein [Fusibacter ferrireducens]